MSRNERQIQESDSKERYASDYFGQLYEWAEASHCQSFQDSHLGISTPRTSHNPMASFVIVQAFIEEGAFDRCS